LAALSGLAVVLATARYGIGVTPDSVGYVDGARSIADGRGYVHLDGSAVALFAPGYAAVLAGADWLSIDLFDAARVIGIAAFAATVVLAHHLLGMHVRSRSIRVAATIVVACSAVLLEVYTKALSESVFVPVVLLFLLACEAMLGNPRRLGAWVAAIALSWVAFYVRYAGIVTCAVGALVVASAFWSRGARVRAVRDASLFGTLALSLPALWMLRNVDAVGDPLGPRYDAARPAFENVVDVAKELSIWVATGLVPSSLRLALFLVLATIVLVLVVAVEGRRVAVPAGTQRLLPLAAFVAVYVGYLLASASTVAFREIETRFLLPVFVPMVVLGAWLFEQLRERLPSAPARNAMSAVGLVAVCFNAAWFADSALELRREGAGGYAQERWQDSILMDDVRATDLSRTTYTNDIRAVELFIGVPMRQTPARTLHAETDERSTTLSDFVRRVDCGPVQLIWFEPNQRPQLYTPSELAAHVTLEPVIERRDGSIYEVRPGADSSGGCDDAS
jgi:hypothetical protein